MSEGGRIEPGADPGRRQIPVRFPGQHPEHELAAYVPPASGTVRCHARSAPEGFACNAAHGHPGDHVAYGSGGALCHTWPRDAVAEHADRRQADRRTGAEMDAGEFDVMESTLGPVISETGTLTPEEAATLEFARGIVRSPFDCEVPAGLIGRLLAIVDRLAGITTQDGE